MALSFTLLANSLILLIVFDQAFSDLFPARYKSFRDSQQREWNEMEIIPFPRIQWFLSILLKITYTYVVLLFIVASVSAYEHSTQLIQISKYLCAGGGAILLGTHLSLRLYVLIKGNSRTSQSLETKGSWGWLFLSFLGLSYWLQTLS